MTEHTKNALVFNTTAMKHATLAMEIEAAKSTGYAGIETTYAKLHDYLEVFSLDDLKAALGGMTIYGVGTIINIERHGDDLDALKADAHRVFALARRVGAIGVQVINGPLDYREVERHNRGEAPVGYTGVLKYDEEQQLSITADNLAMLARMAREYGLLIYLEALGWAALNRLDQQVELLRRADQDNLKIVIDYWHCFVSGDTPADVARLDRNIIWGVHVDDALAHDGGVPNEVVLRDVPTGEGVLSLQEWTDAVKATGYDGWWCSETFSRKIRQGNSNLLVPQMKAQLEKLVNG